MFKKKRREKEHRLGENICHTCNYTNDWYWTYKSVMLPINNRKMKQAIWKMRKG